MRKILTLLFLSSFFFSTSFVEANAETVKVEKKKKQFIRIGTGSISGVYYIAANSVCNFVKKSNKITGANVVCTVQSTPGALYNLNAMRKKDIELGAVQSDEEYKAYNGTNNGDKMENLRSVFNMYNEIFTVAVKKDSSVNTFEDLFNKRVNIGAPGSGVRGAMEVLMKTKQWTNKDFQVATELSTSEQAQSLCDNKIDAMIVMMAAPNGVVQTAAATCGIKLVPINKEILQTLTKDHPYYSKQITSGVTYGDDRDIDTFGVKAMFVTRSDVDEDIIYNMVKVVYENFDVFKKSHPALENLKNTDMLPIDNAAPIHAGALKFYKEAGLIK